MNFGLSMSAPLPWLTILFGRFFGKKIISPAPSPQQRPFFKLPRSLKVTRQGRWYIGILLLIGIAAINTGNNLLYLVEGMLLSLIIISGLMSENTLRKLRVERVLPPHANAGSEAQVKLVAFNDKKLLPSLSFKLKEANASGIKAQGAYVLKLARAQSTAKTRRYLFEKRGLLHLSAVIAETAFPFGLFIKGRRIELPGEIIVYPRTRKLSGKEFTIEGLKAGDRSARRKGAGAELYGLREHLPGEDARHVDWKASARTTLMLHREFEAEAEQNVMVVFDNFFPEEGGSARFEKTVEDAASIIKHLDKRGVSVGLKTLSSRIPCGKGPGHIDSMMKTLALIEPVAAKGALSVRVVSI